MDTKDKKPPEEQKNSSEQKDNLPKKKKKSLGCLLLLLAFFLVIGYIIFRTFSGGGSSDNSAAEKAAEEASEPTDSPANTTTKPSTSKPAQKPAATSAAVENEKFMNFFVELANKDEKDKNQEMLIARWTLASVSVGVVEGTLDQELSNCLNTYISDFNSQSSSTKLFRDDRVDIGIPKIMIYYWPEAQYTQTYGDKGAGYAFEEGLFNDDNSFKRVRVFISERIQIMGESPECQTIRHEVMHGVGFWGHSNLYPESIMSLPKSNYIYPEEDKKIIRALYNTGLPLKSNEAATREFFKAHPL